MYQLAISRENGGYALKLLNRFIRLFVMRRESSKEPRPQRFGVRKFKF